jgi:hypothetical protein
MSKRILFVLASPEYLRYFDTTMALLVERGHTVAVSVNWLREKKHARLDGLIADPRIEILGQVPSRDDLWLHLARAVRGSFDFVRYLHPSLAGATALRERARRKSAPRILWRLDRKPSLAPAALERIYRICRTIEASIPVSGRVVRFLRAFRPDLVVVSPLVDSMSSQVDMVRAAQSLGIPAALAVASWDNLTNKGHVRVQPDLVTVWNDKQKAEAITLHDVAAERVEVTGAQLFDRWFERQPSQSRDAFCTMVGLPADRPIVLYTASSIFIARSELEVPFVRAWLTALRATAAPGIRDAAVLVRPHPFNGAAWEHTDLSDLGPVAIWPRGRYTPASETSRDGFFDSLFYSSAVVGINTSAMIEAAILRKPVLSLLTPQFGGTQEGTLHFRYLLPEHGGFLRVASTVEAHLVQLSEVIDHPETVQAELNRFVGSFIRPLGVDQPCTPRLADALERAAHPAAAARGSVAIRLLRVVMLPVAALVALVSPKLDAEGRAGDSWSRRIGPALQLLRKRLIKKPLRSTIGTLSSWTRLSKRTRRATRRVVGVLARRPASGGRTDTAPRRERVTVPRSEPSDGP